MPHTSDGELAKTVLPLRGAGDTELSSVSHPEPERRLFGVYCIIFSIETGLSSNPSKSSASV